MRRMLWRAARGACAPWAPTAQGALQQLGVVAHCRPAAAVGAHGLGGGPSGRQLGAAHGHTFSTAAAVPDETGGGGDGGGGGSSGGGGSGGGGGLQSAEALLAALATEDCSSHLTPAAVVEWLGRFIVGQEEAKRAVAVAFRNRWRRHRVAPKELQADISPKNILMIGPTGCGKTEIARRLAQMAGAPFVKVEATKFTEVGYHGRDADSIVRDLVDNAITLVRAKLKARAAKKVAEAVEGLLLRALAERIAETEGVGTYTADEIRAMYRAGDFDDRIVEVDVPSGGGRGGSGGGGGGGDGGFVIQGGTLSFDFGRMLGGGGPRRERRRLSVAEARPLLEEAEAERLFPQEMVAKEAVRAAEEDGIVFIDELDKIVTPPGVHRHGSDPSSEGVQRDLLPIIEGSTISTKHGNVSTDHILFIASGAFHSSKPSDMLAELQGRLPIRVELKGLTRADFERILVEPQYNLVKQQQMLLGAEGVDLVFTDDAVREIAALAEELNTQLENIGARRLHTVMERLVEDISFEAPDRVADASVGGDGGSSGDGSGGACTGGERANGGGGGAASGIGGGGAASSSGGGGESSGEGDGAARYRYVIDAAAVRQKVGSLLKRQDLSKFIL